MSVGAAPILLFPSSSRLSHGCLVQVEISKVIATIGINPVVAGFLVCLAPKPMRPYSAADSSSGRYFSRKVTSSSAAEGCRAQVASH